MWLPPTPRMLWVVRCHEGGGVVVGARAVWRWSAAQGLRALGCFVDAGWQDLRAVYPPTAICGAFRIHGAHILPKPARFGCMARESCHEAPLFSSEAPFGIHGVKKLPRIAARERIRAQSCHRQAPGNAFHGYLPSVSARNATAPCASTSCVAAPSMLAPNAPPMPYVPDAHAPAPPATAPRHHAPYAALLSPLKK